MKDTIVRLTLLAALLAASGCGDSEPRTDDAPDPVPLAAVCADHAQGLAQVRADWDGEPGAGADGVEAAQRSMLAAVRGAIPSRRAELIEDALEQGIGAGSGSTTDRLVLSRTTLTAVDLCTEELREQVSG